MRHFNFRPTIILALYIVGCAYAAGIVQVPNEKAISAKRQYDDFASKFLVPEDFELAANRPVVQPSEQDMDSVQNSLLFEGDIVGIPMDSQEVMAKRLRDEPLTDEERIFGRPYHSSLNLVTYPDKLWTDGVVPYMLEEGMTSDQRAAIAQAFDEYKQKTCIRFVPRNDDDFDYIYVKRNVAFGCSSYVGRAGGNQTVSLEVDKCFSKGIIAHELMHAIGFFHEHSRTDRDQFVDIVEDHIRPGMMRNFEKYPRKIIDPLGMPYDYDSVMHYHKLAFSRNGKATIVPKDRNAEIGQRYKLSEMDAKKVNKLYKCGEYAPTTTTTTTTEKPTTTTTEESTTERTTDKSTHTTESTSPSTTTTTTTVRTTTERRRPKTPCEDLNAHCSMWEQLGHCEHSVKYMAHYCRKSCKLCDDESTSTEEKKKEKASEEVVEETTTRREPVTTTTTRDRTTRPSRGRPSAVTFKTTTRQTFATRRRPSTTTTVRPKKKTCEDKNLFCSYWAKIGECKSESKFMKVFCKASCGRCD